VSRIEGLVGRLDRAANDRALSIGDAWALLAEARDEIERLQADAARIDWLGREAKTTTVYMDGRHPWNLTGRLKLRDLRGATFRCALDAAMQADQPPNAALSCRPNEEQQ
jgi:hypothetical protein